MTVAIINQLHLFGLLFTALLGSEKLQLLCAKHKIN